MNTHLLSWCLPASALPSSSGNRGFVASQRFGPFTRRTSGRCHEGGPVSFNSVLSNEAGKTSYALAHYTASSSPFGLAHAHACAHVFVPGQQIKVADPFKNSVSFGGRSQIPGTCKIGRRTFTSTFQSLPDNRSLIVQILRTGARVPRFPCLNRLRDNGCTTLLLSPSGLRVCPRRHRCLTSLRPVRGSLSRIIATLSGFSIGKELLTGAMSTELSGYHVAAIAFGGVAVLVASAASFIAVAVVFQPRWLVKIARKQMPHIVFDHVTKDPMVALTIDDGPNGKTTHQLLDLLQAHEAKATFFLIGQNIDKYPELVDRMYSEGHELGNHTMEDVASWRLTPAEFEKTLLDVDSRLQSYFHHDENGSPMKWFRPGHGWYTKRIRRTIQRYGYRLALGSVYPVDPLFKEKGGPIASYCLWKMYPGAIIVLHDRPQQLNQTIEVLSRMLPELRKRGYQVVTLSELLQGRGSVYKKHPLLTKG
eukprot:TRINITY_DN3903_c0_g3_i1.p1 TRINITY_DN3903_c0_g3~~TRINITY_DN3903_c0_g3_i1.p1  ORF type:complete len:478 (-),score=23.30 TRINITY_DN3903_c0_g3_i1:1071-2504(-)